jgi:lipopolysaccharide export system permease protein
MRLLDRYLLRELLTPFCYCLGGFLIFWIFADLSVNFGDFQRKDLFARDILEYYLVTIPGCLWVVLPIALLLALLYALTNHARHNEITAIRAAGVSLWRVCLPYLVVGFLASLGLFAINELYVPESEEAKDQILTRRLPPKPGAPGRDEVRDLHFVNSRDRRTWQIVNYNLVTGEMRKVQVVETYPDGHQRWLAADRGIRTNGLWTFFNVSELVQMPGTNSSLVPTASLPVRTLPDFTETPEQIRSELKLSRSMALRAAKKPDLPIIEILNYLRLHPQAEREKDRAWLYTKLHGRLAAPWACLVVVLIAIPFGVASGRRNVFVGVASSILICLIYYVLQTVGLAIGTAGWLTPWLAAWLPNLSFGIVGLGLTARVR